jgi:hypothetical protein
MRKYEVELRRTSYITLTVEARDQNEAEEKAWVEIEHDRADINDAAWDVESVTEVEGE